MSKITEVEVAWMAGLFDGEGCVQMRKRPTGAGVSVSMRIGMTCFDAVARMSDLLEQEEIRHGWSEQILPSGKVIFVLDVSNQAGVQAWANLLIPYSIVKQQEMEAARALIELLQQQEWEAVREFVEANVKPKYRRRAL